MNLAVFWLLAGSYLLGAIPFGYLIGRLWGVDVRKTGSGNIGATNVLRAVGKGPAAATLFLDSAKGFLPVFLARQVLGLPPHWVIATGIAGVIGHSFPVFLGFKGGKGVATGFGVLIGINWVLALVLFLIFFAVLATSRIVSLSSLTAAAALPFLIWHLTSHSSQYLTFGLAITLFIFTLHRKNIKRLLSGKEPRVEWKR